jgi:hypothetical protein
MQALLDGIRKNPDVLALLVLCLTLGLGGPARETKSIDMRIHQLWQPSAECVLDVVASHLPQFDL